MELKDKAHQQDSSLSADSVNGSECAAKRQVSLCRRGHADTQSICRRMQIHKLQGGEERSRQPATCPLDKLPGTAYYRAGVNKSYRGLDVSADANLSEGQVGVALPVALRCLPVAQLFEQRLDPEEEAVSPDFHLNDVVITPSLV